MFKRLVLPVAIVLLAWTCAHLALAESPVTQDAVGAVIDPGKPDAPAMLAAAGAPGEAAPPAPATPPAPPPAVGSAPAASAASPPPPAPGAAPQTPPPAPHDTGAHRANAGQSGSTQPPPAPGAAPGTPAAGSAASPGVTPPPVVGTVTRETMKEVDSASSPGGVLTPKKMEIRLSLEDAIRWAIRKNLDIVGEEFQVDITRRNVIVARATFDPFFDLGVTYTKNRDPTLNPLAIGNLTGLPAVEVNPNESANFQSNIHGLSPIGTTYQFSLVEVRSQSPRNRFVPFATYGTQAQVTVTQPLLKGAWLPYNFANIRIAEYGTQIERQKLELQAINTVFSVESAYWNQVFSLKNFESKARALEVARENLRIDQKKVEVGTKARIDMTTSESQVQVRKTEYDSAAGLLEDSRDQLLAAMNYIGTDESLKARWERPPAEGKYRKYSDIIVIPTTEPTVDAFTPERGQSIQTAFSRRPEYLQNDLQIRSQEISVAVARNQLLPSLNLTGSWTQVGLDRSVGDSFDRVGDGDFYDWSVGAVFEVPLSNRGPRAQYRNARDTQNQLIVQKQSLENSIVLEIDRAIRNLNYDYRAVKNLQRQVELQQELLRAERVKLEVGKSIAYTVATIENDLISYEAQLLRAMADYQIAKATYEKAVGDLLQKRGVSIGE